MNIKDTLKWAYDELSPYSGRKKWEFYNNYRSLKFFVKRVPKGATILDVGCGIGVFALSLKKLGYNVVGLDKYIFQDDNYLSEKDNMNNIQKIWEKNEIKIVNEDIFNFSNENKFDCVINIAVIEHQKDPKRFIESCLKHLKIGGYFFCVSPNMVDFLNRCRVMCGRSAFRDLKPFFDTGENFVGHWREYTLREMVQMAEWSGMEIIKAKNYRTSALFNGNFREILCWRYLGYYLI